MNITGRLTAAVIAGALLCGGGAQAHPGPAPGGIVGSWMNPRGTVAVRTGPCGDRLCGWVVWASPQAQQDAHDGGTARLVGTAVLENYQPDGDGGWTGTVFVPDRGRRFYSELEQVDPDAMKLKGCLVHGLFCRSQIWHRIAEAPRG